MLFAVGTLWVAYLGSRLALDELSRYWAAVRELYHPFEEGLKAPGPDVYQHEMPGGQFTNLRQQARNLGLELTNYPARFACGSIFWSRGSALTPLRKLALSPAAFEPEDGSVDGTTAHAIERLFSIFAMAEGFRVLERSQIRG